MIKITEPASVVLNAVRFICSQGVLAGHLVVFFGLSCPYLVNMASYCVLMFFVLSGFLISHSLHQKKKNNPDYKFSDYFLDRFFRIFPPYIAALVFVFAIDLIGFSFTGQYFSWTIYIGNFFINSLQLQEFPLATWLNEKYMIEFFRFHYFGTDLPLWTIAIEWWLYMFYGFLIFFFFTHEKIKLMRVPVLMMLAITPVYYILVSARMEKGLTLYWFLGVLLTAGGTMLYLNHRLIFYFSLLLILIGIFGFQSLGPQVSILIFILGLFLLLQSTQNQPIKISVGLQKLTEYAAGYSYSLYLIHYSIVYFVTTVFNFEKDLNHFIMIYVAINIVAYIFAEIFEKKSKSWKLKYENYRSRTN
ncbi:MAG: acyltransferase [Flavobacteriales bacterium]|nr:acyltransferase [Flavobacteriales bacterium]